MQTAAVSYSTSGRPSLPNEVSTSTGISPFGFSARYSGDLCAATARSTYFSSNGTPSSSSTMCGIRLALPGK